MARELAKREGRDLSADLTNFCLYADFVQKRTHPPLRAEQMKELLLSYKPKGF